MGILVTFLVVSALGSQAQSGAFSRYDSIAPSRFLKTTYEYRRGTLAKVPDYATSFPWRRNRDVWAGRRNPPSCFVRPAECGERADLFSVDRTRSAWAACSFNEINLSLLALSLRGIRRVEDHELRLLLAAVAAPLFALFVTGVAGITTATSPGAPYLWAGAGILAYWLVQRPHAATDRSP